MHKQPQFKMTFILVFAAVTAYTASSKAFVEIKANYGGLATKDFISATCGSACTGVPPANVPLVGISADLIISPPLTAYGFGIRYEKLNISGTLAAVEATAQIERIAALVNYRFIDTILKIGPVFTVGISNQTQFKVIESGTTKANYTSTTSDSASAGLEIGIKPLIILPLILGVETGYQYLNIKNAIDSVGGSSKNIDLSGLYLKAYLGLSF